MADKDRKRAEISRRALLQGAIAGGAVLAAGEAKAQPPATKGFGTEHVRGVNLGSWLVPEKWMVPSVYAGTSAADTYTLCRTLGKAAAKALLQKHYDTFITEKDFAWIAEHGLNAVRLPIGYWLTNPDGPYVSAPDMLAKAFQMAERHKLAVLLDLHGAPGSQNGWDHSGRAGALDWPKPENVAHTLQVVDDLAQRCSKFPNLLGIELLNEPRWDVPIEVLKSYYEAGYKVVRKHIPAEQAAVVMHDGFRPAAWGNFMNSPEYSNAVLDTHIYQCYSEADNKRSMPDQVHMAMSDEADRVAMMEKDLWTIVGEWSGALPGGSVKGLTGFRSNMAQLAYISGQLYSYESSHGWFFWSYKLENGGGGWSLRDSVQSGIAPQHFGGRPLV